MKRFNSLDELWNSDVVLSTHAATDNAEPLRDFLDAANELVAQARVEDQAALRTAVANALDDPDPARVLAALNRSLPDFLGRSPALEGAWERLYATAALRGWAK